MRVKLLLPYKILVEKEVSKIIAEGENGSFCLLPRHIDFVSALVPGILILTDQNNQEEFYALNEGILVKYGAQVLISTQVAVKSASLEELKHSVLKQFKDMNEQELAARLVMKKLEVDMMRRFLELGGDLGGQKF